MTWYSLISLVRNVSQEESESRLDAAEHAAPSQSTSDDSRCIRPSRSKSYDVDSPSAAASLGVGRRSLIGLSEKELLKCAFSYPQTEGISESPDVDGKKKHIVKHKPNDE